MACECSACRSRRCRASRCRTAGCGMNTCGCGNAGGLTVADSQPGPTPGCGCAIEQTSYEQVSAETGDAISVMATPVSVASCDSCSPVRGRGIRGRVFRNR
jgi:hypothetical protein